MKVGGVGTGVKGRVILGSGVGTAGVLVTIGEVGVGTMLLGSAPGVTEDPGVGVAVAKGGTGVVVVPGVLRGEAGTQFQGCAEAERWFGKEVISKATTVRMFATR